MPIKDVIKNIFTFTNILAQSGTSVVASWNEASLKNAFNWAEYCKQVEEQTRTTANRDELDVYIQCLTLHLSPVCLVDLKLDKLKDASVLLCKRLLRNTATPAEFINYLHDVSAGSQIHTAKLPSSYLNHFFVIDVPCRNGLVSSEEVGQHVLDILIHIWKLLPDNRQHGFNKFVSKLTDSLSQEREGMEVIGHILLAPIRSTDDYRAAENVKSRIMKTLVSQTSVNRHLLGCGVELLCKLSERDDTFLQFYRNQLIYWAKSMKPVYSLTVEGDLYTWQCCEELGDNGTLTFSSLVCHMSKCITYNQRLKKVIEPVLQQGLNHRQFSVWKDLHKAIQDKV